MAELQCRHMNIKELEILGCFFHFYCVSDLNSDLLYLCAFVFYLYNSAVKINPLVIVKGSY